MENISAPVVRVLKDIGPLLYIASPSESSFERVEEVPNYVKRVSGCCNHRYSIHGCKHRASLIRALHQTLS